MISNFNMDKLQEILKDFYNVTQIRIVVFNEAFQELAAYPEEYPPVCKLVRSSEKGWNNCMASDQMGCHRAAQLHSFYTYVCHAGMTESIAPIYVNNLLTGYLFFGNVLSYESHEAGLQKISEQIQRNGYRFSAEELKQAVSDSPLITADTIESASHILQAVAGFLYLDRMVSLQEQELPIKIDEYLSAHFAEPLSTANLCQTFGIGKTQLYRIAKENYGTGIAEHIRNLRLSKAKDLLRTNPQISISEVVEQCGFPDYNNFITLFKKETGLSPKAYARETL